MKLFSYEVDGSPSLAVQRFCLHCEKPVLIEAALLQEGELYFCTHCGLDWRFLGPEVSDLRKLLQKEAKD